MGSLGKEKVEKESEIMETHGSNNRVELENIVFGFNYGISRVVCSYGIWDAANR